MGRAVVIAVVNHKGGCGKTATVTNLGAALASGSPEMGIMSNKVLIVDLDPRGNVATTFGVEKRSLGQTMNNLFEAVIDGSRIDTKPYILSPQELTRCMRGLGSVRIQTVQRASEESLCRSCFPTSCRSGSFRDRNRTSNEDWEGTSSQNCTRGRDG